MLEPSTGQLVLAWSIIIVMYIGFSALAGFILWACARRIGKISKATFMNSWGLFWILHISQIAFNLVFWFFWTRPNILRLKLCLNYQNELPKDFPLVFQASLYFYQIY